MLRLDDIKPDNDFTKDANSGTDLYTIEIADKYEYDSTDKKIKVEGVSFVILQTVLVYSI